MGGDYMPLWLAVMDRCVRQLKMIRVTLGIAISGLIQSPPVIIAAWQCHSSQLCDVLLLLACLDLIIPSYLPLC